MGWHDRPPRYLPTPAQIRQACGEIQATWTPETRERRRAFTPPPWLPPVVHLDMPPERPPSDDVDWMA